MSSPEGNRKIAERLMQRDPDYFKKLAQKRKAPHGPGYLATLKSQGRVEELKKISAAGGAAGKGKKRTRRV